MFFGTLMSCSGCNTCLAFALYAGCNSNSDNSLSGCNGDEDDEDDDETPRRETDCHDGVDNDGDDAIDCRDVDCRERGECGEYYCYDERDDDGDGLIDCDDSDCCDDPICACQCEARCDEGERLCVSDGDACVYECCSGGQTCTDGECHCEPSCAAEGTLCLYDDARCLYDCCNEGERCGDDGCESDEDLRCATTQVIEPNHELSLDWNLGSDFFDLEELDGCGESEGRDALFEVFVPANNALHVEMDEPWNGTLRIVDQCPPSRCESSALVATATTTLWINNTTDEEGVLLLVESDDSHQDTGRIVLSEETGESCESAISVDKESFSWSTDARLYSDMATDSPCRVNSGDGLFFSVELEPTESLTVASWSSNESFLPSLDITDGDCDALRCLAVDQGVLSYRNDLDERQRLTIRVGWGAEDAEQLHVEMEIEAR